MGACFQRGHLTIVFDRQTEYIWCSDGDQDEIARKVMDQVTKLGGRFLLPSKKLRGTWVIRTLQNQNQRKHSGGGSHNPVHSFTVSPYRWKAYHRCPHKRKNRKDYGPGGGLQRKFHDGTAVILQKAG
jgi:hypothetical protein